MRNANLSVMASSQMDSGFALPAGMAALCRPGGIGCEVFCYVFGFFLRPYKYVATHLMGEIASAIRAIHDASYKSARPEFGDYLLLVLGILEYLVYWFVAGVVICGLWRAARTQVQVLRAHRLRQVDLAGRGK